MGKEVTVPVPPPAFVTVKVKVRKLNVAVQVLDAPIVTLPSLQSASPLHPAKTDPVAAVAVKATTAPLLYISVQSTPQLIPTGKDVTVPVPVPVLVTVKV